jgi:hypothetical protein
MVSAVAAKTCPDDEKKLGARNTKTITKNIANTRRKKTGKRAIISSNTIITYRNKKLFFTMWIRTANVFKRLNQY